MSICGDCRYSLTHGQLNCLHFYNDAEKIKTVLSEGKCSEFKSKYQDDDSVISNDLIAKELSA